MTVVAADHLRAFVERIMRLKEEQDTLATDIREVYAEAKGMGFDKQAMGQLVTYLRKKEKDGAKLEEQSAIFELYRDAYEHGPSHAHTREGIKNDPVVAADATGDYLRKPVAAASAQIIREGEAPHQVSNDDAPSGEHPDAEFEPPLFLVKKSSLRPHCQNPDVCAGYGAKHCHACLQAAALNEAAA